MTGEYQSWTMPVNYEGISPEVTDALFSTPESYGTLNAAMTCPVCGERLPVVANIDSVEQDATTMQMHALVTNDADLRAHVVTHGLDPADTIPLEILVRTKR